MEENEQVIQILQETSDSLMRDIVPQLLSAGISPMGLMHFTKGICKITDCWNAPMMPPSGDEEEYEEDMGEYQTYYDASNFNQNGQAEEEYVPTLPGKRTVRSSRLEEMRATDRLKNGKKRSTSLQATAKRRGFGR